MQVTYSRLGHVGRLGNQLWQIASTVGIARKNNLQPVFPSWDYRPFFSLPSEMFDYDGSELVESTSLITMDERYIEYLQSFVLFEEIADEVRSILKPSAEAEEAIAKDLPRVLGRTSLHVRRGDNLRELNPQTSGYHLLQSVQYYQRAVKQLGGPVVIFSDDPKWCERELIPKLDADCDLFVGQPRPDVPNGYWDAVPMDWIDLLLMSKAERHIIANSSYSWWGAFLANGKRVVYPSNWYGHRLRYIPWTDMIPNTWIGMD